MRFLFFFLCAFAAEYTAISQPRPQAEWKAIVERYAEANRRYAMTGNVYVFPSAEALRPNDSVSFRVVFPGDGSYYLAMHDQEVIVHPDCTIVVDSMAMDIAVSRGKGRTGSLFPFMTDSVFQHFAISTGTSTGELNSLNFESREQPGQRYTVWYESSRHLIRKYEAYYYDIDEATFKVSQAKAVGTYVYLDLPREMDEPRWHVGHFLTLQQDGVFRLTDRFKNYNLTILPQSPSK